MSKVGMTLKEARESKRLTLEEASNRTGIRQQYLEALENGEYSRIPGEMFIKGFLRNYGKFLDLDGAKLVRLYLEEKDARGGSPKKETSVNTGSTTREKHSSGWSRASTTTKEKEEEQEKKPRKPWSRHSEEVEKKVAEETKTKKPWVPRLRKETNDEVRPEGEKLPATGTNALSKRTEQRPVKKSWFDRISDFVYGKEEEEEIETKENKGEIEDTSSRRRPPQDPKKDDKPNKISYMKIFIITCVILLLLVGGGVYYLFLRPTPKPAAVGPTSPFKEATATPAANKKPAQVNVKSPAVQSKSTDVAKKESKEQAPKATEQKQAAATTNVKQEKKLMLDLRFTHDCWAQIFADGEAVEAETFKEGDRKVIQANEKITINVGSINYVEVKLNGKLIPAKAGEFGEMEKTFTLNDVR